MLRKLRILTVYSEAQCKALPKALRTVKKNARARGSLVAECTLHLRFNHKCGGDLQSSNLAMSSNACTHHSLRAGLEYVTGSVAFYSYLSTVRWLVTGK